MNHGETQQPSTMKVSDAVEAAARRTGLDNLTSKKTFCQICPCFCGLEVVTDGKKIIRVLPDKQHEFNWRDFCAKGGTAGNVRDHPKRLRTPLKRVGDRYVAVPYDQAIKEIALQLTDIKRKHGADAIATYMGNPGAMNSAGAMFQGGFTTALGIKNNYAVGSIDQNNWHVVGYEMYGSEFAALLPDIDHAKCILLLGSNPSDSGMNWISIIPRGWDRLLAAQANGADFIVVDPRKTPSTKKATTHVQIKPGEDWALLLGMIKTIFEQGWIHHEDCAQAHGVDVIRAIAADVSMEHLSRRCEVSVATIQDIARRFATADTAFCEARTGVSLNRNGTLGEWLSHVLNLITGRIDRKGGRTYCPGMLKNYMALYNKLVPSTERRSRIGNYPAVTGAYPMAILADEIHTPGPGQVRALIIHSGNPVSSGPDGASLDDALKELELLICIDLFQRESHRHAHWLIPGTHFLERDGFVGISNLYEQPFVQLGQATIEPPDGVRSECEFFRDLAVEMKAPFMGVRGLNTIIRASRWLARATGRPRLAFGPRWLWAAIVKFESTGVTWKKLVNNPGGLVYGEKSYDHFRPALQTADKKINAAPAKFVAVLKQRLAEPVPQRDPDLPLLLISRRRPSMMNSWLVETNKHPRVFGDYVEISATDAAARAIQDEQAVVVSSRTATLKVKARITDDMPPGIVGMDHGWGSRLFDPQGNASSEVRGVMRNWLVARDVIDELAGAPNLNGTGVDVRPDL